MLRVIEKNVDAKVSNYVKMMISCNSVFVFKTPSFKHGEYEVRGEYY